MTGLAVPVPYQWQVGDVITASLLDAQLYNGLTFLLGPPMFEAVQTTTTTSITSTTTSWTPIAFADSAGILSDTYGGHSTTTNPSQYVAQVPGWYSVSGSVAFQSNATGNRGARIAKNGSPVQGTGVLAAGAASGQITAVTTPTRKVYLNGTGDYLEIHGMQNSGSTLLTGIGTDVCPSLSISFAHN